jgi:TolB-like protein/DNA-binding winged helix-turn-helix (wHTH) protein/cytochrome c-type biogenesis protein CcmH/NrfG
LKFRFSDLEINIARHELRRAGTIVHIEPQVFDLLVHLVRNRDRIVSKNELIDAIWHGRAVSEATLSSRISAARRALGDSGYDQSLIRTLHKRGFRFVGDVDEDSSVPTAVAIEKAPPKGRDAAKPLSTDQPPELPDTSSIAAVPLRNTDRESDQDCLAHSNELAALRGDREADPATSEDRPRPPGRRRAARNLLLAAAVIGVVPALVAAAWWLRPSPSPSVIPNDRMVLASIDSPVPSIAVLPFTNLSGDATQDYVADGITGSVTSDLARALPGISVVSRDTASAYKSRGTDARQVGRELEVRYLLEGSVVVEGNRIRVNVQLVETKDGSQLWAERLDTERTGLLQVQDEIAGRVLRAIGLQVVDLEARRSWRERPDKAEPADLVMRGKAVLNRPSSPATMMDARDLFEQALKLQPSSADALAGVATTLVFEFLNGYYKTENDKRLYRAGLLLDRALTIEPRHLIALKAKAALRRAQGKFDDAIAAAETVIMENPGEPWAYKEIGLSTLYLGKPEQALDWFAKAERIGPRDPGRWTWLDGRGHALILLGRDEDAVRALSHSLDANPRNAFPHAFLAAAYAFLDRPDEARAALAAYEQMRPGTRVSTFRSLAPVPLALTSRQYQQQRQRLNEGLRKAGMPE